MKRLSTLSLTKSETYGERNKMRYTEIKENKRVANPKASWLSDALQSKVNIFSHMKKILLEMKFKKNDALGDDVYEMDGGLEAWINSYDDIIRVHLSKTDKDSEDLGECLLVIEYYKSKNPKLVSTRDNFKTKKEYKSECYLSTYQHLFIDELIQSVRFLWEIK